MKTLFGYLMIIVGVLLTFGNVPDKVSAIGVIIILVAIDRVLVNLRNEVSTSEARA